MSKGLRTNSTLKQLHLSFCQLPPEAGLPLAEVTLLLLSSPIYLFSVQLYPCSPPLQYICFPSLNLYYAIISCFYSSAFFLFCLFKDLRETLIIIRFHDGGLIILF